MRPRILKDNLILSEYQKEVLTGLLLGDGCLEKSKNSSGARLKVDQSINQFLTTTALAVWFMSDGSIKSKECRGRILNTQSFTRPDIERLIFILKSKFNLQSSIRTQKDGLQIYISAKSAEILNSLLKAKILPSFHYKLPLKS